jgi:hypothetical protein
MSKVELRDIQKWPKRCLGETGRHGNLPNGNADLPTQKMALIAGFSQGRDYRMKKEKSFLRQASHAVNYFKMIMIHIASNL